MISSSAKFEHTNASGRAKEDIAHDQHGPFFLMLEIDVYSC